MKQWIVVPSPSFVPRIRFATYSLTENHYTVAIWLHLTLKGIVIPDADYDTFVGKLLSFKMIVNELGKETADRTEIDDSTTDLDFYVDKVSAKYFLKF